jgi:hypothetical protein
MGRQSKQATRKTTIRRWITALVTAGVASAVVAVGVVYVASADSAGGRAAVPKSPGAPATHGSVRKAAALAIVTGQSLNQAAKSAATETVLGPLALPAEDTRKCPAAAAACVDLARHLTWLQSGGKITFGPVRMEPGGSASSTPRGTFAVIWKGGPNVVSDIWNEPMPWAVQFTTSGVAFHAGSLTVPSHGCIHLTMDSAHYYNEHLVIGSKVVVF